METRLETILSLSFFFFQAEDGIRDGTVTGVQTCALPICARASHPDAWKPGALRGRGIDIGGHTEIDDEWRGHRGSVEPCERGGVEHRLAAQIGRASCRERV